MEPGGERTTPVATLDALLAAAPDAMVGADAAGRIVAANARCERLLGYAAGELVGESIERLVPRGARDRHVQLRARYSAHPDVRDMEMRQPLRARRRDGTELPVEISLAPLESECGTLVLASLRDVSRARYDERLFRLLLEAAPDAILVMDPEGTIVLVNAQAETMFGYPRAILIGSSAEMLVPDRLLGMHETVRSSYMASPQVRPIGLTGGLFGRREDGTEFPIEVSLAPVDAESGLLVLADVRDISERVRLTEAVRESEALRWAQEQVHQAKDEFFAAVSHELRTPLASIIGYTELILDLPVDHPDREDFLAVVERNAQRELRLVDDLLTLVSIRDGGLPVHADRLDLVAVLDETVEEHRAIAGARGIHLILDRPDGPILVAGDGMRLGQAVGNLLTNAVKFSPEDGSVRVTVDVDADVARIDVADNGIGIVDVEAERIFERLYRGANAVTAEVPGAGLGLAIVRAIVEAHQGSVQLVRSDASGTTFRLEIPLDLADEADLEAWSGP